MKKIHEAGWIHGDIKPNNILFSNEDLLDDRNLLLDEKYEIVLIDFGLSHKLGLKKPLKTSRDI